MPSSTRSFQPGSSSNSSVRSFPLFFCGCARRTCLVHIACGFTHCPVLSLSWVGYLFLRLRHGPLSFSALACLRWEPGFSWHGPGAARAGPLLQPAPMLQLDAFAGNHELRKLHMKKALVAGGIILLLSLGALADIPSQRRMPQSAKVFLRK